jgi:hypothetical protein
METKNELQATGGNHDISIQRTIKETIDRVRMVQDIARQVMKDGVHYGTIPHCGDKKVLFKSGAELLCFTFRMVPKFRVEIKDLGNGHREYVSTCQLCYSDGTLLNECTASASTMEPKFRYHWVGKNRVENDDIADKWNTVMKISEKRSFTQAVIIGTGSGDVFTTDLIDTDEREEVEKKVTATVHDAPERQATEQPAPKPQSTQDAPKDMSQMEPGTLTAQGKVTITGTKGKSFYCKINDDFYTCYATQTRIIDMLNAAKESGAEVVLWYKKNGKYNNISDVDIVVGEQKAETEQDDLPF